MSKKREFISLFQVILPIAFNCNPIIKTAIHPESMRQVGGAFYHTNLDFYLQIIGILTLCFFLPSRFTCGEPPPRTATRLGRELNGNQGGH